MGLLPYKEMKITLKDKDFDRFIKRLIKPRKPNKALLDAVKEMTMKKAWPKTEKILG